MTKESAFDYLKGKNFFFLQNVQTGDAAYLASYPMGTGVSLPSASSSEVKNINIIPPSLVLNRLKLFLSPVVRIT
jgi:hypothetical protein